MPDNMITTNQNLSPENLHIVMYEGIVINAVCSRGFLFEKEFGMSKFRKRGPLCGCDCGGYAKFGNKYIHGHHNSVLKYRMAKMGDLNVSKRPEVKKKQSEARKGKYSRKNSPTWKGGFYINKQGIKMINTLDRGEIAEARLIVEKVLGRYLTSDEVVHHIDEDRANNSNNNLLVCTKAYHLFLHRKMNPNNYKYFGKQSVKTKEKRAKKHRKPVMVDGIKYLSIKEATEKSKWCFATIRKRIFNEENGYMYLKKEI